MQISRTLDFLNQFSFHCSVLLIYFIRYFCAFVYGFYKREWVKFFSQINKAKHITLGGHKGIITIFLAEIICIMYVLIKKERNKIF